MSPWELLYIKKNSSIKSYINRERLDQEYSKNLINLDIKNGEKKMHNFINFI